MKNPDYFGAAVTLFFLILTIESLVKQSESLLHKFFRQMNWEIG